MTRLHIDFAPPSLRRTWFRLHPALLAAGLCGLALCLGAAAAAWQVAQQREERGQLIELRARAAARLVLPAAAPKAAIPLLQAAAVNAAIVQLNVPWSGLQDAVEAATPATVALLALEPDAKKRLLQISAEVKTAQDMVTYIEQLKQQELFTSVILNHHETNLLDPNRPLRFQLQAQWSAP